MLLLPHTKILYAGSSNCVTTLSIEFKKAKIIEYEAEGICLLYSTELGDLFFPLALYILHSEKAKISAWQSHEKISHTVSDSAYSKIWEFAILLFELSSGALRGQG